MKLYYSVIMIIIISGIIIRIIRGCLPLVLLSLRLYLPLRLLAAPRLENSSLLLECSSASISSEVLELMLRSRSRTDNKNWRKNSSL